MTVLEHDWFPGTVPHNVRIDPDGWFHSTFAFRHFRSRRPDAVAIGPNCGIYIGTLFDLGPHGEVSIGRTSTLTGPIFVTDHRIEIGDRALISAGVVLADEPVAVPFPDDDGEDDGVDDTIDGPRPVVISMGDDCWIGTGATLLAGAHLGDGVIVGAGTVVDFTVPAGCVVAGNPGRIIRRPASAP